MLEQMNIRDSTLNNKLDIPITNTITRFDKRLLTSLLSLYNHPPENIQEMLNEYIIDKTHIKINYKMVTNKYIKENQNVNLKTVDLLDIYNNENCLPYQIFTVNYSITVMKYDSKITAISHKWKKNN